MKRIFIKPLKKTLIPETLEPLPVSGMRVTDNSYWQRRIKDGSVKIAEKDEQANNIEDINPSITEEKVIETKQKKGK